MLVLSRKVGQRIRIGDNIYITVVRSSKGGARLGIDAPADIPIIREELQKPEDCPAPCPTA
jgi:carbon storage regulator